MKTPWPGCSPGWKKAATQVSQLRNCQTQIMGHDHGAGACENAFQRLDGILLLSGPLAWVVDGRNYQTL